MSEKNVSFRVASNRLDSARTRLGSDRFGSRRHQNPPAVANCQPVRRRVTFRLVSVRIDSNRFESLRVVSFQIATNTPLPLRMARSLAVGCVSFRVVSPRFVSSRICSRRVATRTRLSLRMTSPLRQRITFRFVSCRLASTHFVSHPEPCCSCELLGR